MKSSVSTDIYSSYTYICHLHHQSPLSRDVPRRRMWSSVQLSEQTFWSQEIPGIPFSFPSDGLNIGKIKEFSFIKVSSQHDLESDFKAETELTCTTIYAHHGYIFLLLSLVPSRS